MTRLIKISEPNKLIRFLNQAGVLFLAASVSKRPHNCACADGHRLAGFPIKIELEQLIGPPCQKSLQETRCVKLIRTECFLSFNLKGDGIHPNTVGMSGSGSFILT